MLHLRNLYALFYRFDVNELIKHPLGYTKVRTLYGFRFNKKVSRC